MLCPWEIFKTSRVSLQRTISALQNSSAWRLVPTLRNSKAPIPLGIAPANNVASELLPGSAAIARLLKRGSPSLVVLARNSGLNTLTSLLLEASDPGKTADPLPRLIAPDEQCLNDRLVPAINITGLRTSLASLLSDVICGSNWTMEPCWGDLNSIDLSVKCEPVGHGVPIPRLLPVKAIRSIRLRPFQD